MKVTQNPMTELDGCMKNVVLREKANLRFIIVQSDLLIVEVTLGKRLIRDGEALVGGTPVGKGVSVRPGNHPLVILTLPSSDVDNSCRCYREYQSQVEEKLKVRE